MVKMNKALYLEIAQSTDVFAPEELDILDEVLVECENPKLDYLLIDDKDEEGKILGFLIFGRTPLTEFCWDVYWLCVHKGSQCKGVGRKLLKKVQEHILERHDYAVLRVETSTRKEYAHARNLYLKKGYLEVGRIPNFYRKDDDLIIFSKIIEKNDVPDQKA